MKVLAKTTENGCDYGMDILEKLMTCPLNGNSCVTQQLCSPAVLFAKAHLGMLEQEAPYEVKPECPIVTFLKALNITATALLPLALGMPDDYEGKENEEDRAKRVLDSLKLDG